MPDKYLTLLTAIQALLIPLVLLKAASALTLLPLACAVLVSSRTRRPGTRGADLSILADGIVNSGRTGIWKSMRNTALRKHPQSGQIAPLVQRFLFGDQDALSAPPAEGPLSEFVWLLHIGLSGRKNSVRQIVRFSERVKERIRRNNSLNSRLGSSNSIAMLGLTFFLPLFGGISTAIFGISSTINTFSYLYVQSHFVLVLACYIVITMFINAFFRNPLTDAKNILYDAVPRVSIAVAILVISASYAPYIA